MGPQSINNRFAPSLCRNSPAQANANWPVAAIFSAAEADPLTATNTAIPYR
ncbi:MAG: hypothetical protein OIF40_10855 [Mangrovicoccus sp.]|nr:hypothetical protein [Mangrovicoccus sp.]